MASGTKVDCVEKKEKMILHSYSKVKSAFEILANLILAKYEITVKWFETEQIVIDIQKYKV